MPAEPDILVSALYDPISRRLGVTLGRPKAQGVGTISTRIGPFELDPYAWIDGMLRDRLATGKPTDKLLATRVEGLGRMLGRRFLSDEQRMLLAERSREADSLLILSSESWVPWEHLGLTADDDTISLGQCFALTRGRFERALVSHLPLTRLGLVPAPD